MKSKCFSYLNIQLSEEVNDLFLGTMGLLFPRRKNLFRQIGFVLCNLTGQGKQQRINISTPMPDKVKIRHWVISCSNLILIVTYLC